VIFLSICLRLAISGYLFGDQGYISQELFESLYRRGIKLVTKIRKNMNNSLIPMLGKDNLEEESDY